MSINLYREHVFVLPEDDANKDIANGFLLEINDAPIRVLPVAGGWRNVMERFQSDHVRSLERRPLRHLILLIDFDGRRERMQDVKDQVPKHLENRVFVLGAWSEPERLKPGLGSYESIGRALAQDCRDGTDLTWSHELLRCNETELTRLRALVRPILFP